MKKILNYLVTRNNMKSADYKCYKCNIIREIYVEDKMYFPKSIPCLKCEDICKRIFSPLYNICHRGKTGNSKNGYTSNPSPIKKT